MEFAEHVNSREVDDECLPRFHLVGGKPRYLFSTSPCPLEDRDQEFMDEIPRGLHKIKKYAQAFLTGASDDQIRHLVFSFCRKCDERPGLYFLKYSSLAVESIIEARFNAAEVKAVRSFLDTSSVNLQSWRGREIEDFLLQDLATFTICVKSLEGSDCCSS